MLRIVLQKKIKNDCSLENNLIFLNPQQQKRQQKLDSKVTLDSLTSPERSIESTEHTAEIEHYKEEAHGEENPAQSSDANTDEKSPDTVQAEAESEDDEESITDCDSSVKNRFTLLSDEQQSNNSTFENKISDTVQDLNEDSELVSDMKNVTLDEAFIEDSDASDHSLGRDEPLESKEYTVVKQDRSGAGVPNSGDEDCPRDEGVLRTIVSVSVHRSRDPHPE